MAKTTIVTGMLLTLLGVVFYAAAFQLGATSRSATALIPSFVGVPLILLGYGAVIKPTLRKHFIHVAVVLALLGFLASFGRLTMVMVREPNFGPAVIANMIMSAICITYVILAIRSFVEARRARDVS